VRGNDGDHGDDDRQRMRPHGSTRARTALALAALPLLSGCLTQQLWLEHSAPEPRFSEHLVGATDRRSDGVLLASEPVLEHGLWWRDAADDPAARPWWLYPPGWDRTDAEVAAALLADPGLCTVVAASVHARRRAVVDDAAENATWLELALYVADGAVGRVVPPMLVPPAAARRLARDRAEPLLAAELEAFLPAPHRRAAAELAPLDFAAVTGGAGAVHADGWVFVDANGRPQAPPDPLRLDDVDAPLAAGIAALRELALLVRVRSGGTTTILRVRPDRLWLANELGHDGERCVHRSRWFLQTAPRPLAAAPGVDAPAVGASLSLHEERYWRRLEPSFDSGLLGKIALTPVTIALDVLFGPQAADFWQWLTGRNARPAAPERRGR
jgi:hypothetical protein